MCEEHFDDSYIHTTPDGRHFRHGDGVEVDGEGNPIEELDEEPDRRSNPRVEVSASILRTRPTQRGRRVNQKGEPFTG